MKLTNCFDIFHWEWMNFPTQWIFDSPEMSEIVFSLNPLRCSDSYFFSLTCFVFQVSIVSFPRGGIFLSKCLNIIKFVPYIVNGVFSERDRYWYRNVSMLEGIFLYNFIFEFFYQVWIDAVILDDDPFVEQMPASGSQSISLVVL